MSEEKNIESKPSITVKPYVETASRSFRERIEELETKRGELKKSIPAQNEELSYAKASAPKEPRPIKYNSVVRGSKVIKTRAPKVSEKRADSQEEDCSDESNNEIKHPLRRPINPSVSIYGNSYFTVTETEDSSLDSSLDMKCSLCEKKITVNSLSSYVPFILNNGNSGNCCKSCFDAKKIVTCKYCQHNFENSKNFYKGFCGNCQGNASRIILKAYTDRSERHFKEHISDSSNKLVSEITKAAFGDKDINSFSVTASGVHPKLIGVELEYEVRDNYGRGLIDADEVIKKSELKAIIKRDGTLQMGFEVVSCPADIKYHREAWNSFFEAILNNDSIYCAPYQPPQQGADRGTGCGCHIHISKNALTHGDDWYGKTLGQSGYGLAASKLMTFIHNPNNRQFIEIMAGRKANMFSDFTTTRGLQFKNGHIVSGAGEVIRLKFDHRTAVNFESSNGQTVEFRIFRSTKDKNELLKNIDFVASLCDFCRPGNASIKDMASWVFFYEFVCKNRQDYPYLYKFFDANDEFKSFYTKTYNQAIK